MNTVTKLLIHSTLLLWLQSPAQRVSAVYKTQDLLKRPHPDSTYVINFWASWCKPCIQELPAFDSLNTMVQGKKIKVLLVSLDFKEDMERKTEAFLKKKNIRTECVLLDEIDGNSFINQVDPSWSGAIPATLMVHNNKRLFVEKKMHLKELEEKLKELD